METSQHICPFGLRARELLKRQGYKVDDQILSSRDEVEQIKSELGVKTTPQIIIEGERIGGFDDLKSHLGKKNAETSYIPVIALFSIAGLLTAALYFQSPLSFSYANASMQFIGLSMIMLGLLKLQDLEAFVNGFLGYDLVAQRYVPYAFVYPFAEVLAGLLMISSLLPVISIPLMLFIGGVGGVSVFKAVYIDKRELKCACVGGGSNVPLGLVSFLENGFMFGAGIWMLL
jgi:glutaredoxin